MDMTFEEAMGQLEAIVKKLEEGRCGLQEAISAYEEGAKLKSYCERILKDAELRVEQVILKNTDSAELKPFDAEPAY